MISTTAKTLLPLAFLALVAVGACQTPSSGAEERAAEPKAVQPPEPREGMVRIPQGLFLFGADEKQIEFYVSQSMVNFPGMVEAIRASFITPRQSLDLETFYIQQFEVSNREFKDFLEAANYRPERDTDYLKLWEGESYPDWAETFPVVWVSQKDAEAYCRWRGAALPDERQWEKAARGMDGRYFPWGNVFPNPDFANFNTKQAEPVGNRPGDVSPFEVYDMGGNVAELTATQTPVGGTVQAVVRGGSFRQQAREMLTVHRDLTAGPDTRRDDLGFRCVSQ